MSHRSLVAEFIGTFMLVFSILAAAFYAFQAPAGESGILGVAVSVGFTVMAMAFAIGPISGGHYNPAVTLGLIAGGRVSIGSAPGYIIAQCLGALAAVALLAFIGKAPATYGANGYDAASMLKVGMLPVFLLETVLTAFFLIVMMGATSRGVLVWLGRRQLLEPGLRRDPVVLGEDLQAIAPVTPQGCHRDPRLHDVGVGPDLVGREHDARPRAHLPTDPRASAQRVRAGGDGGQERVAHGVPEGLVDRLEAVENIAVTWRASSLPNTTDSMRARQTRSVIASVRTTSFSVFMRLLKLLPVPMREVW